MIVFVFVVVVVVVFVVVVVTGPEPEPELGVRMLAPPVGAGHAAVVTGDVGSTDAEAGSCIVLFSLSPIPGLDGTNALSRAL
jgi:hypothetical protein